MFIATQLNSTQLDVELSTCSQREQLSPINERSDPVDSVCRSWRHKQKHDWLGCTLFNWVSWVELCCYRHPSIATQLNSTSSGVELSCVAINTPLNHHLRTAVHRNEAIFEFFRAFDHILIRQRIDDDNLHGSRVTALTIKQTNKQTNTHTRIHNQTLLKTILPSLRYRCACRN